jgi:hypothetical protein
MAPARHRLSASLHKGPRQNENERVQAGADTARMPLSGARLPHARSRSALAVVGLAALLLGLGVAIWAAAWPSQVVNLRDTPVLRRTGEFNGTLVAVGHVTVAHSTTCVAVRRLLWSSEEDQACRSGDVAHLWRAADALAVTVVGAAMWIVSDVEPRLLRSSGQVGARSL